MILKKFRLNLNVYIVKIILQNLMSIIHSSVLNIMHVMTANYKNNQIYVLFVKNKNKKITIK